MKQVDKSGNGEGQFRQVDDSETTSPALLSTKLIDDVFTDAVAMVKPHFQVNYDAYLGRLWEANPEIYSLLQEAADIEAARDALYRYLESAERSIFGRENNLHILEKGIVRECVRVMRSIAGPINEARTDFSALDCLWKLANGRKDELASDVSVGFLMEFINLFRGIRGKSHIYLENGGITKGVPAFLRMHGRAAARARVDILDDMGSNVQKYFKKYPSGLESQVVSWRGANRARILRHLRGTQDEWEDYRWQLRNVIRDGRQLLDLIEVTTEQQKAIEKAVKHRIPFGITPYYVSLMDSKLSIGYDHAVRAQVIPPREYVDRLAESRAHRGIRFDFMGENDTSPVELVTRRYPGIAIIKPFNTCAQICVYCQRNWELKGVLEPSALASAEFIDQAVAWLMEHSSVGEVLVTGGDPMVMSDDQLRPLLEALRDIDHIYRIRIGTRTPVVLPMRITDDFMALLSDFHDPPRREIALVTHFEHSYEVTPEAFKAVQKIRKAGMSVYNQEVFTVENSRRFETAKLRRDLKSIGVDPYYTFNMKGKEETRQYMVPIARILQERKEEARLLPGLDRTDEPVFNVPRLGKNHLRAWQDHRLVMIRADGSRVYELHPWEKNIAPVPPYNYDDVPIYDYLEEMAARGESIRDYRTIWYYF